MKLGVVITGGTIGSRYDQDLIVTPQDTPFDEEVFVSQLCSDQATPVFRCPFEEASENLLPKDWQCIATSVRELVTEESVEGVLILHGTDTMAYTASALSFLLADVDVPIVITGSRLPKDDQSSDAPKNVQDSLCALRHLERGVYVVFSRGPVGLVHLGTRVRKTGAQGVWFESINREPVGEIVDGNFQKPRLCSFQRANERRDSLDGRVLALRIYPGLNLAAMLCAVQQAQIKGVVLELYMSNTGPQKVPLEYSLPRFVEQCVSNGIPVFTTTSRDIGRVEKKYSSTKEIEDAGAVYLADMIPETALVKLMWALGVTNEIEGVKCLMVRGIAGEVERA